MYVYAARCLYMLVDVCKLERYVYAGMFVDKLVVDCICWPLCFFRADVCR